MKFTTTLLSLLTTITTVHAECYSTGDTWQNAEAARWHIERACKGYDGNQGAFQGYFLPGEAKYACVQHSGSQKYEFFAQNLNTRTGFDLGDVDCVFRLQMEVNNCARGGESEVAGWRFRSDPGTGFC
ncbi:hypothetical protein OQA88_2561 [Cercophora sp. LCS_1]